MYMVRDGPLIAHAAQFRRGRLPRPVFLCCGVSGLVSAVGGGITLGIGQRRYRIDHDYTLVLIGSISLGVGFICIILTLFLSLSWSTFAIPDYDGRRTSRSSSTVPVHRTDHNTIDIDDLEMEGFHSNARPTRSHSLPRV